MILLALASVCWRLSETICPTTELGPSITAGICRLNSPAHQSTAGAVVFSASAGNSRLATARE